MLAYDKEGNPLEIDWWARDSELNYHFLGSHGGLTREVLPGQKDEQIGGWKLNAVSDPMVQKIAYVLFCDMTITFEDGNVWTNPEYETWRTTYEGQKIDIDILENYYPYEQKITIPVKAVDLATSGLFRVTAGSGPEQSFDYSEQKQTTFVFAQGQKLKIDVEHITAFHVASEDEKIKLIFEDSQQHTVEVEIGEGEHKEVIFENAGAYRLSIQNDGVKSLWYSFILQ